MSEKQQYLIEILVPKLAGDGNRVPADWFDSILEELTERFGGAASFARRPGKGLWTNEGKIESDAIAIIEVMTGSIDALYWQDLRNRIERDLSQKEVVIRAHQIFRL